MSIDTAIENATASIIMEGLSVDEKSKELVKLKLENKITMEEYLNLVKAKVGVL